MFDGFFTSARALARHQDAPFAEERSRYIKHCVERGSTALTIALKCRELLWAARLIDGQSRLVFNKEALHALAVRRSVGQRGDPLRVQERFEAPLAAILWGTQQFLKHESLRHPEAGVQNVFDLADENERTTTAGCR